MKLYLGAGTDRVDGFTHVDIYPYDGIDIVCDVTKGIPVEDNSVEHVFTRDFLEHIESKYKVPLMNEIYRILVNNGVMEHFIPNAGSRNDYGSPTHLSHWNLQQFEHFDINSYRYQQDHVYEGFTGKFRKIEVQELNPIQEIWGLYPQSIHVIYQAIK